MGSGWLIRIVVVLAVGTIEASGEKQRLVEEQIRYLELLQLAESHLGEANPDAALVALDQALACEVFDTHLPKLKLTTKGATAHYLRACAHAVKDDSDAALASLKEAAANGFRNSALVKSDPRLANVRKLERFAAVLEDFNPQKSLCRPGTPLLQESSHCPRRDCGAVPSHSDVGFCV